MEKKTESTPTVLTTTSPMITDQTVPVSGTQAVDGLQSPNAQPSPSSPTNSMSPSPEKKPLPAFVKIEDTRLEAAIRLELNKKDGELGDKERTSLRSLNASNRGIHSLKGLENFPNLQTLRLNGNPIQDWTSMTMLSNITTLEVDNTGLTNLEIVRGMNFLDDLSTNENGISDISPLRGKNLSQLSLISNNIGDLRPLASDFRLQILKADDNKIEDISVLAHLQRLTIAQLSHNRIRDIAPIGSMKDDSKRSVDFNPLTPASIELAIQMEVALKKRKSFLRYEQPPVSCIPAKDPAKQDNDPIAIEDPALEKAVRQDLRKPEGPITVQDMKRLRFLNAVKAGVTKLNGLEYADELAFLRLMDNKISDIAPLCGLTKLKDIDLSGNKLERIDALQYAFRLESLNLSSNSLNNVDAILALPNIKYLFLDHNPLRDVRALRKIWTPMEMVNLSYTKVESLEGFQNITIRGLNISYTNIKEIGPLMEYYMRKSLDYLTVIGTPLSEQGNIDLNALASLDSVKVNR